MQPRINTSRNAAKFGATMIAGTLTVSKILVRCLLHSKGDVGRVVQLNRCTKVLTKRYGVGSRVVLRDLSRGIDSQNCETGKFGSLGPVIFRTAVC